MSEVVVPPMLFLDKARCQRVAGTSLFFYCCLWNCKTRGSILFGRFVLLKRG